jgi:hypothetical protein
MGLRRLPNHTAHSRDTGNHPLRSHMGNRHSKELMARLRQGRPPNNTAHSKDTDNHHLSSLMDNRRNKERMAHLRQGRPPNNTAHNRDMGNHRLSSRTGNSPTDNHRPSNIRRMGSNSRRPLRRPDTGPHRSLRSMAMQTHTA